MNGLPRESASVRAMAPWTENWSNTEELLAALIETVDHGNRLFFSAHRQKHSPVPSPIQIPRPYERDGAGPRPRRRQSSTDELVAFFGGRVRVGGVNRAG